MSKDKGDDSDQNLEISPIEQFLAQSEKRLRGRVSRDKIAAALAEARDHLTYRAEDLMAEGETPAAAEASAASTFGDPREWAREILNAENMRPHMRVASDISVCGFSVYILAAPLFFALNFAILLDTKNLAAPLLHTLILCLWTATIGALAAGVGAMVARRCPYKSLIGMIVAVTVFAFFAIGISAIPVTEITGRYNRAPSERSAIQADETLLELGASVYASSPLPAALPSALKTPQGFVAPVPQTPSRSWRSPKKGATETVATEAVAARQWRSFGSVRLAECQQALAAPPPPSISHMTARQIFSTFHWRTFSWQVGLAGAVLILLHAAVCLVFSFFCALLGWMAHRIMIAVKSKGPSGPSPAI